jgi:hypothetical protein
MIFARAQLEKAKVTETYEVGQVISVNPQHTKGKQPKGRIEITVPHDGDRYFTRQAVRDVEHARTGLGGATDPDAVVGHLLLAGHDQVESLPTDIRMRGEHGVLPLAVPLTGTADLTGGRTTSLITHEYRPKYPRIIPAELAVEVLDPDMLTDDVHRMSVAESLDYLADSLANPAAAVDHYDDYADSAARAAAIEQKITEIRRQMAAEIRQSVRFQNLLMLEVTVRLALPRDPKTENKPTRDPIVRRISIDWPTITSLRTTELDVYGRVFRDGEEVEGLGWHKFPVRYNPVDRRLEWEVVRLEVVEERGDGSRARTTNYQSLPMQLLILHPGELYRTPRLKVRAEVEIPGYLMSGLDPRLFDATGKEISRDGEASREQLLDKSTRVTIDGTLVVDDAFAKRDFSPHHTIVFENIIPDEMRVADITRELRDLGFGDIENVWSDHSDPNFPNWFLSANRSQGPDQMKLWVYLEGTRTVVEHKQTTGSGNAERKQITDSGQIKLHILGSLPHDHLKMTREMNALQRALRVRYGYHRVSQE